MHNLNGCNWLMRCQRCYHFGVSWQQPLIKTNLAESSGITIPPWQRPSAVIKACIAYSPSDSRLIWLPGLLDVSRIVAVGKCPSLTSPTLRGNSCVLLTCGLVIHHNMGFLPSCTSFFYWQRDGNGQQLKKKRALRTAPSVNNKN